MENGGQQQFVDGRWRPTLTITWRMEANNNLKMGYEGQQQLEDGRWRSTTVKRWEIKINNN